MTGPFFTLVGFLEAHDDWVEREQPSTDLSFLVLEWFMSRVDDPYRGARRAAGFDNLWYVAIPRTGHQGQVVVCSFWIEERDQVVRCDNITSLSPPF